MFSDDLLPGHSAICSAAEQNAESCDTKARFPHETIAEAKRFRVLSPDAATLTFESGLRQKIHLCYDLGRVCSASSMVLGMHYASWEMLDRMAPRDPHGAQLLDRLRSEQGLIASLTTEFGNSGDITKSQAVLVPAREGYEVFKKTPICSYLEEADAVMVLCQLAQDGAKSELGIALHTSDELSLTRLWKWNAIGMRGTCSHGFDLHARSTGDPALLDEAGDLLRTVLTPASHIFWATTWLGIFDAVMDMALTFMNDGNSASPAAMKHAAARLTRITEERDEILARLSAQIARYVALHCQEVSFGFYDTVDFNDLKVVVSERLSHNMLDLLTILGTRYFSNPSENSAWRKYRDLSSSMFMISNDLINYNSSVVRRLAGRNVDA